MISFSGLWVCCIGLIWCILLGVFYFMFATKPLVLLITRLFWPCFLGILLTLECYYCKIIQMHIGLGPFTLCIALATAFAHKSQCFQCKYIFQSIYFLLLVIFCKVYRSILPSNAYSKCYSILLIKVQKFSLQNSAFHYQTLYKCYNFVLLRALASFVSKHDWWYLLCLFLCLEQVCMFCNQKWEFWVKTLKVLLLIVCFSFQIKNCGVYLLKEGRSWWERFQQY